MIDFSNSSAADGASCRRGRRRTVISLLPAALVLLGSLAPAGASAQVIAGEPAAVPATGSRPVLIQIGFGANLPIAHLAATDKRTDGFAKTGMNIALRSFIPLTRKIDIMADLILPRFSVAEKEYNTDYFPPISDALYKGKVLSLGARWFAYRGPWRGEGYLMISGGMYQLVYERFDGPVQVITEGAFRPGAAIGAGIQLPLGDFDIDASIRYHRFTDTGHFGLGDLSWLEIGLLFSLRVTD